ncbi:MAG: ribosome recycling factor [bacterium]|nr:ribosome recycling factor [bacterium]
MTYNLSSFDKVSVNIREGLKREYDGVRTSRATPAILDNISVECYGSLCPIKQVASIVAEGAKTLLVSPYDVSQNKVIEKAITAANLGLSISSDEKGVRVSFPELTSERRQALIRVAREKLEEARIKVRQAREEVWSDIQKKEKTGEVAEDDKFRLKDELQKKVDALNKELSDTADKKEKEILG